MYSYSRCSCCKNNSSMKNGSLVESSYNNNNSNISNCGFNKAPNIFPDNPMLGQSYVPIQYMNKTFTPMCGLKNGSLFPELINNYYPGQSMMDNDYLKMTSL